MEIVGSLIQELLAVVGYAILLAGVYKLYQIATDIREIKEAIKGARRLGDHVGAPASMEGLRSDTEFSLDAADSYAENLLRTVSAQTRAEHNPVESGAPRP